MAECVIFSDMVESRKVLKLKWCLNNQDQIKMDSITLHHSNNDFGGFWRATQWSDGGPSIPASVDGLRTSLIRLKITFK